MSSQNNKKVVNSNVNTNLKYPVPIRPKPTVVLEQNSSISSIKITTEPASTSKEIAIDLTMVCTYIFVQN